MKAYLQYKSYDELLGLDPKTTFDASLSPGDSGTWILTASYSTADTSLIPQLPEQYLLTKAQLLEWLEANPEALHTTGNPTSCVFAHYFEEQLGHEVHVGGNALTWFDAGNSYTYELTEWMKDFVRLFDNLSGDGHCDACESNAPIASWEIVTKMGHLLKEGGEA